MILPGFSRDAFRFTSSVCTNFVVYKVIPLNTLRYFEIQYTNTLVYQKNREAKLESRKSYYQKNRETELESRKHYYQKNSETELESRKHYYQKNSETELESRKHYYRKNRETELESMREFYQKNRDVTLESRKEYQKRNRESRNGCASLLREQKKARTQCTRVNFINTDSYHHIAMSPGEGVDRHFERHQDCPEAYTILNHITTYRNHYIGNPEDPQDFLTLRDQIRSVTAIL
jgi:hypothetical protein